MKVAVLGAGGPAGVNVCRALHAAGHEVLAFDDDERHLEWCRPYATPFHEGHALPDVFLAQPDASVWKLAERDVPKFLPKPQTIALCQDKFECGLAWRRAGLREDRVESLAGGRLTLDYPLWVRARYGAGAKAAICAAGDVELMGWWTFWTERGVELLAEEFLPGRDFSWCGIYTEGHLRVSFLRERLEYLYPGLTPEGITGTPTRAVIVDEMDVSAMAHLAVTAVDESPHGVFCVDLREDSEGTARPTEINAGRFSTTVGLWSLYSERSNFVALAAELAVGDESRLWNWEILPAGLELSRHIDCGHQFSKIPVAA